MTKFIRSFRYAFRGIRIYLHSGGNSRFHLVATVVVIALGIWLEATVKSWCLLVLAIGLVHAAEIFNTAIEKTIDLISPGKHPLAGQVKDLAAGAVLLSALAAALTGALVFIPLLRIKFS